MTTEIFGSPVRPEGYTAIPFTQYLLPRGERRAVHVYRPYAIAARAKQILALGYTFECEVLTTSQVSLSITGKNTDVYIEIVNNGPEVLAAVDRLVMAFDGEVAKQLDEDADYENSY